MGNSFRSQPMPSRYDALQTPVTEDTLQVGLLFAFGIIAASFILIIPGIRGWERLWATIRVFTALWIGAILLVCNYGSWLSDSICTRTQYKAHTKPNSLQLIQATVGISINLRGFNVTLIEMEEGCGAEDYERPFPGEKIYYVESFGWAPSWRQGRLDFGVYGEQFRLRYREAQHRGMPLPILWVAESFLLDGEQFRWYRKFRVAGWYTHIFMWVGFATYLMSILLFIVSIRNGALFMFLTGVMMCLAALTYGVAIQNDPPFLVHFPDGVLKPTFNYSFYLTVVTGGLTILAAIVIALVDMSHPRKVATFFHHAMIEDDTIFEGLLEEEVEEEEPSGHRGSKTSYGGKISRRHSRRGTVTHRDQRESIKSGGPRRRSNVHARESTLTYAQESSNEEVTVLETLQSEVELEMVTVHHEAVEV